MRFLSRLLYRQSFAIPPFEPVPFEFEEMDELLLDRVADSMNAGSKPTPPGFSAETPGELRERIEIHLGNGRASPPVDAADELRHALSDIRRSLG